MSSAFNDWIPETGSTIDSLPVSIHPPPPFSQFAVFFFRGGQSTFSIWTGIRYPGMNLLSM
jgi:hypothetical protein